MKITQKIILGSGLSLALALGLALGAQASGKVMADGSSDPFCAKIVFSSSPTTEASYSTGTSFYTEPSSSSFISVDLTSTSGNVTQKAQSGEQTYPVKIGTGSASGSLVLSLGNSYYVDRVYCYALALSGTAISTTKISVSTDSGSLSGTSSLSKLQSVAQTLDFDNPFSAANTGAVFTFSSTTNETASKVTISNNDGVSNNHFYLYQVSFRLRSAQAASSSSSSLTSSILNPDNGLSIHFVELDSYNTGDCTYIKAGDTDILIDAGSTKGAATTIESYLDDSNRGGDYVSDGKLEYVIATHAHEDHISGFVGTDDASKDGGKTGIFYHYQVDNLIDFSYFDNGETTIFSNETPTSGAGTQIYQAYVAARSYAVGRGTIWKTIGQRYADSEMEINLGSGITLKLLYTYFVDHTSADVKGLNASFTKSGFSSQNDMSVCALLTYGTKNFLFTGDAEAYAEYSLVQSNVLPQVDLMKGGHHGSYTANSDVLLSVIQPKMVCICCCAGTKEYAKTDKTHSFPAQEAINRIAPYTDRVYVTTLGDYDSTTYHVPFNGNIVIKYLGSAETLTCSNNSTKLKDTAWFKSNRTCPSAWAS